MNKSYNMNIDTGEKTWLTPPHIIQALGPFDLDPCCPPTMPWRTAKQMVHWPNDGLKVDWTGQRVWCNPPYGRDAVPFLRKMAENKTGGGAFCYISHGRILPCGTTSYSRTPLAFCSFVGASSSVAPTERQQTRLARHLRSSRTPNGTLCACARAACKGRFCAFDFAEATP